MAIVDEPVRGSVPPAWFAALPGIDRMRALAAGQVVRPPIFRLLAIRVGHVAPGSVTLTMPASAWLLNGYGNLDVHQLVELALSAAAITALPPATEHDLVSLSVQHLRPVRPDTGTLLARARLINASRLVAYAEVDVEDANGRSLAHGAAHATPRPVEPAPPSAPLPLRRVDEAEYATPDPLLRPTPRLRSASVADMQGDALGTIRGFVEGRFRSAGEELLGLQGREAEPSRVVATLPASEWFTCFGRTVSVGTLAQFANVTGSMAALTNLVRGVNFAGLEGHTRLLGGVPADGRDLWATASARVDPPHVLVDIDLQDADGRWIGASRGSALFVDEAARERRHRSESRRVLATLLFTDVVDSTRHAERLGDAAWGELLGEFRAVTRAAIARAEGAEIDTAGDGFFVRFESPGAAIACARAIRDGVARLGIDVRSGIHTGECELEAGKPTGMAVHVAARIEGRAAPGEILVSDTVRALAAGAGLRFEDRGSHDLKGVPEPWRLHAVEPPA